MIEVRVLEFDRLGKAYVVDPKTLNVYETESIKGNPYSIYDEKGDKFSFIAMSIILIVFVLIANLYKIYPVIAKIAYIILLIFEVLLARFVAYKDKYFYDIKDLKLIEKEKYKFQIKKFIENINESHKKRNYSIKGCNIGCIILVLTVCLFEGFDELIWTLVYIVYSVSLLLFNKEWERRRIFKKLLASLEQE